RGLWVREGMGWCRRVIIGMREFEVMMGIEGWRSVHRMGEGDFGEMDDIMMGGEMWKIGGVDGWIDELSEWWGWWLIGEMG
ncbi:hypothetical protein, partial [Paenibacillus xylanexedens]|uniref:hypothetical protein n=1 Tax=Paenibacillus xylanexedens TaxID=528191 RepID=UPI001C92F848